MRLASIFHALLNGEMKIAICWNTVALFVLQNWNTTVFTSEKKKRNGILFYIFSVSSIRIEKINIPFSQLFHLIFRMPSSDYFHCRCGTRVALVQDYVEIDEVYMDSILIFLELFFATDLNKHYSVIFLFAGANLRATRDLYWYVSLAISR